MVIRRSLPYAVGQFFMVAFQWAAMLFLPVLLKERGVSEAQSGFVISMFSFAALMLVFPLGALADRLAIRPLFFYGAVVTIVSMVLIYAADTVPGWAAAAGLAGAGWILSSISLYSLFLKQMGETGRGFEVSIFSIGGVLGAGAGSFVCGHLLAQVADKRGMFILAAAFAAMWALVTPFLPKVKGFSFPILEYKSDLRYGRTWLLIAIVFLSSSHTGFEQASYTLLQTEHLHLSTPTIGRLFLFLTVWMSAISLWAGRIHDRNARPLLMLGVGLVFSGVFMSATGAARGEWDFLAYRMLHTVGDSIFNVLTLVVAAYIFPKHRFGGAWALISTIGIASIFASSNIAGVVGKQYGTSASFYLSGAIMAVGGTLLLLFRPRLRAYLHIGDDNQTGLTRVQLK